MTDLLPLLLGWAVLLPLVSFFAILIFGSRMGKAGEASAYIAVTAIVLAGVASFCSLGIWVATHWPEDAHHHGATHSDPAHGEHAHAAHATASAGNIVRGQEPSAPADAPPPAGNSEESPAEGDHHDPSGTQAHAGKPYYSGEFHLPGIGPWVLGQFGDLRISINYYIDALTICMFCMVTLIATLIHFYAIGYMHEELHDVTDHEVTLEDGRHLHRSGRFHRFFQYLSLFCFSMLGLVIAGNIAMVFVFWELVGICSYFLIGFYVERKSASTAANKAFIVNRVGDFGMIIGLMALWTGLGTFSFGDYTYTDADGAVRTQQGIFNLVRSGDVAEPPDGMVLLAARHEVAAAAGAIGGEPDSDHLREVIGPKISAWRDGENDANRRFGYGLLIVAGIGIFAGCVGKSAQFPLHVWLPDAMEGPTPVSALVHSATMVAAGVYLVGRFFPVFTPEVLLVIAVVGCITLLLAASIALTATDIKRVLAYSTVSQLGYMMLALGIGGWLAGMMHLITHAFFKSLLFMCSGSVIHAVHTNEMTQMGGLRKKMPVTAYTMLIGCLAIAGAGVPFIASLFGGGALTGIGLSGFYSKDAILEQAFSFMHANDSAWAGLFFLAATGGAVATSFYMFRLWFLTFASEPRDAARFAHAHESPPVMYLPLIILAVMAIAVAWSPIQGLVASAVVFAVFLFLRLRPAGAETDEAFPVHRDAAGALAGHHEVTSGDRHDTGGHHEHDDHHEHNDHHANELGRVANWPLYISGALFVVALVWAATPLRSVVLVNLLEAARPDHTLATTHATLFSWTWPSEADAHAAWIVIPVSLLAIGAALAGFLLATSMYGWRLINPEDARRQFGGVYTFLVNKWWFDELYDWMFVKPTHLVARCAANFDKRWIDRGIDGLAWSARAFAVVWDRVADQNIIDRLVNAMASLTYSIGNGLPRIQTGSLRQYVMFIVVGAVAIFFLISIFWNPTLAG